MTLLLLLPCSKVSAQKVSTQTLQWNVNALCDSLFEGRSMGSRGAFYSSMWIKNRFVEAGLQPYDGRWFHLFEGDGDKIGRNVVGYLPGTSGKWIVVAAYYDGIGTIDGRLYPGADTNASGVAALIGVASMVRRDSKDGIIFVALDGHNSDYAGARYMLKELKKSKTKVKLMVTLDTIGSNLAPVDKRRPRFLIALGGEKYSKSLDMCAKLGRLDMHYDYYRSKDFTRLFYEKIGDQKVFLQAGIPAVVFTSGITMETNKVSDTPETLNYELLRSRILCISRWLSLTARR